MDSGKIFDLLVIGGGINGTGIALDAAGRGLSVILCEQNDLGSGTSSASTKLIHGGLRYLEHYDFKLVNEALYEREILMRKAPHLISPLRFIIPYEKNQRPKWMIQIGLWIYDHLGRSEELMASKRLHLDSNSLISKPLAEKNTTAFAYSDCWVDDARLVVVNAVGASQLGAHIHTHTEVTALHTHEGRWEVNVYNKLTHSSHTLTAKVIVNATGPWIKTFIEHQPLLHLHHEIRLVRGSHIIVPKQYEGDHAYLLQGQDGRIIFVIPYEGDYTLIGTTEVATDHPPGFVQISEDEKEYLIGLYNSHFATEISRADILWEYSGVRPLVDEEGTSSTELSRDYLLETELIDGAPILSVYGGKITTYRRLAESALNKLSCYFPHAKPAWTERSPLPGGDLLVTFDQFLKELKTNYPWAPESLLKRMGHQYGSRIHMVMAGVKSMEDLGKHFGADCYEKELAYLVNHEWARSCEDLLFRRTKLGLHLNPEEVSMIKDWLVNVI